MAEREEIDQQFRANLERVRNLVVLYEESVPGGRGRKPVPVADLLRAAVVLLHATLEDLLRSLAEWKLPSAPAASLERIPLTGSQKSKEKFTLVDLAEFRGLTVDSVIAQAVDAYLERATYNHPGEVADILDKMELKSEIDAGLRNDLAAMMSRRHLIAHRADRNPRAGVGHQMARSLSAALVKKWIRAVDGFGTLILELA